ncbi:hypothetical protein HMPREF9948_1498 [Propionibacterium sp. 434-HC2]|nr:hypothetical protein HMPREF9948_1498 [Propionibacterium sp. 434-HC2]
MAAGVHIVEMYSEAGKAAAFSIDAYATLGVPYREMSSLLLS